MEFRLFGGGALVVCNTHLDHQLPYLGMTGAYPVQREQAEILLRLVDDFADGLDCPRVILGDFNSPSGAGAPPLIRDAGYVDGGAADAATFVGFNGDASKGAEAHI